MNKNKNKAFSIFFLLFGLIVFLPLLSHVEHAGAQERTLSADPKIDNAGNAEIDGSLLLGFDARPCDVSLEGNIRYTSAKK